jgi:hypothetical protein
MEPKGGLPGSGTGSITQGSCGVPPSNNLNT